MQHYPLKFRRVKKNVQPRLRTRREFLSTVSANMNTIWGTDMLSLSISQGMASGDNKRLTNRKLRKRRKNSHQKTMSKR